MKLIPLGHGKFAKVDDEDVLWLIYQCSWCLSSQGYAHSVVDGKEVKMHLLIAKSIGLDLSKDIDHKDRDRLNNQKNNLRPATRSQTNANKKKARGNLPKGVRVRANTFQARVKVDGIEYVSGGHLTPEEAHEAYLEMARYHFGEFATGG